MNENNFICEAVFSDSNSSHQPAEESSRHCQGEGECGGLHKTMLYVIPTFAKINSQS